MYTLLEGLFEGLKAYRTEDGSILLFRPEENAWPMRTGAERMCMPSPTVEHFVDGVKKTVLAKKRWVPPPGKGSLYIRPLLMGSGAVLGLAPAPKYTFLIFVSPVGNYFKERRMTYWDSEPTSHLEKRRQKLGQYLQVSYEDFVAAGSLSVAREKGLLRS